MKKHFLPKYLLTVTALIICAVLSLILGSEKLSVSQIFSALFYNDGSPAAIIVRFVRLPRLCAALLSGFGLALSGTLLQNVTRNELAGPNIIGVNSGAGIATISLLCFFPHLTSLLPLVSSLGAIFATLIIIALSRRMGGSKVSVILAGIALTAILNAGISFISLLDTDALASYNFFSIGGLSGVRLQKLLIPSVMIGVSFLVSLILSGNLGVLCLGDSLASSLGIRVSLIRTLALVTASVCAAASVSFAGLLGFVGLVVPHISRALFGHNVRRELLTSPLIGAALVTLGDTLGRFLIPPTEIPVGIVMAAVGAPFFLILLLRRKNYAQN